MPYMCDMCRDVSLQPSGKCTKKGYVVMVDGIQYSVDVVVTGCVCDYDMDRITEDLTPVTYGDSEC